MIDSWISFLKEKRKRKYREITNRVTRWLSWVYVLSSLAKVEGKVGPNFVALKKPAALRYALILPCRDIKRTSGLGMKMLWQLFRVH